MKLLAYGGVASECPANSLPAFLSAAEQAYDGALADVAVAESGTPVLGQLPPESRSAKYAGLTPLTLAELLDMPGAKGLELSLSNRWESLPEGGQKALFRMLADRDTPVTLHCAAPDGLLRAKSALPGCSLAYDGPVDSAVLRQLRALDLPLTVWLPAPDGALAQEITGFAALGIGPLVRYEDMAAAEALGASAVSTPGQIKPVKNRGVLADMHTHSHNSHDGFVHARQMARGAAEAGVGILAITDHYDGFLCWEDPQCDVFSNQLASFAQTTQARDEMAGRVHLLRGIELGEGFWAPEHTERVLHMVPWDAVIGATHAVESPLTRGERGARRAFSQIAWSGVSREAEADFFTRYFDDVLRTVCTQDMDILPHLGCPRYYIDAQCGRLVDLQPWEKVIDRILEEIIARGIALEVPVNHRRTRDLPGAGELPPYELPTWVLEHYLALGGYLITLSTDAHRSERVGRDLPEVAKALKALGFRDIFYLEQRRFCQCAL